jgi:tetratricopeptide (TPR) repeat protein
MLGKDAEVEGIMERIVAQLPGDPEAVAYLERRYRARGNFAGLHKMLMEAGLSRGLAPNVRVMRLKEAAALAEGRLNDAEGAVTAWKRVIAIDPNHGDARRSLERLLRKLEKWADLVELLEQRVQMAEDEAEKLQLLTRIAGLQETQLKDQSATLDTLWRIHAQEEREVKHLKKIETLADQTQRWEDLARVLQVQVEMAATSAEKLRAREKLLVTQQEKLNAHPEALETVDAILAEHRDHLPTLKRQVDLFVTTAQPDRAADALDALVGKLPEKERPAALGRLAELARTELKDLPRAADALNRALQLDPTNESVREELHKMYEELGRFPDIAASYEVWAKAVKDPAKRKALLRRAAQVYDQQVGDIEAACERYGMILKEGDDVEALEAFARLHEMQQDWAALVDNVVRRANLAAPPEDKARLLTEAAQILDGRLGEPAKAAVHLKRILAELSPDHRETLGRLVDVLVRADDYRGAAGALERLREATQDPEEALKHSETLGQWYREPLQDYPKAIATYERILQDWSGHGGALLALTELYDKVADYEKLLRVLRQRSKAADLPPDQANLLLEGAKVAEDKLKDAERAWGWYQEALARDPDSGDLFDAVTAAGRRLAKWESLAGLFEAAATRARTEEERVQRLREAAKVWEEDMVEALRLIPTDDTLLGDADRLAKIGAHWELLGKAYDHLLRRADLVDDRVALLRRFASTVLDDGRRPEFALGPLLRAMEEHPDDNSLFESYEKAARASGHYEDLLRAYDKRCRLATEPQARWPHMLRAAEVYAISMGNLNKGLQVVGLAIGQDVFSDDLAELALRAVRNIEEQVPPDKKGTGWRWLVQHYERLANQYELTDPTRIVFHRRIATVQLDGAGDPAAAFEAMRMAHLLAPTDELLVQDLEKLAREHSFLEPLAAHFADALQRSTRVDVAKDLHRRRAALLEDDLGRADEAAEHYWQLLQLDPDDTEARQKIARYYESAGRWNDLVVILEEDLSKVLYEDEKIALLNRIAAIWEDKIGNRYEAIDSYRKILRLRPDDDDIKAKIKRLSAPRLAATPEDTMEGEEAPAPPPESAAPASEPESSGEAAAPAPPPGEEVSDTAPEGLAPREPAVPEPSSATLTEGLAAAGEAPAAEAPAAEAPPEGAVPGEPGGPSLPTWDERDDSSRVAFSQLEFVQQGGAAPAEPRDTTPEEPGAPAGEPFVVGPPAEEPSPPTPPPGRAGQDTTGEIDVASIEEVPEPAPPRAPSTPPPLPTGARGGPPKGAPPRKRRW